MSLISRPSPIEEEMLSRRELQALAKERGIKANQSNEALLSLLHDYLPSGGNETRMEAVNESQVEVDSSKVSFKEYTADLNDIHVIVGETVEVLCDETVWKFATIKKINKKSLKVCVNEDGSLIHAKLSEIRRPISNNTGNEEKLVEKSVNDDEYMEEELTEYQQELMELAVRESILNCDSTPMTTINESTTCVLEPLVQEKVKDVTINCATPNKLTLLPSKSPKPNWNSSSKPTETMANTKRKSFSNTPVKSTSRPLNSYVKLNKTQQLRQEALKKRLQKDTTVDATSKSMVFTTKSTSGTPNYKKIHQKQFNNMKAITSIHTRDEGLNNKLTTALHIAKSTSAFQPTKKKCDVGVKEKEFKAKPLPKFYKSNVHVQKENMSEIRPAIKMVNMDNRRLNVNATNSIIKDLTNRNGPFTDLINNL